MHIVHSLAEFKTCPMEECDLVAPNYTLICIHVSTVTDLIRQLY